MAFRAAAREVVQGVVGVVSVCGIADFRRLRDAHLGERGVYEGFIRGALGEEWEEGGALWEGVWGGLEVVVLGQGRGDALVEWGQVEVLVEGVRRGMGEGKGKVRVLELEGGHEVWRDGREVARCVGVAVEMLRGGEIEGGGGGGGEV